MINLQDDIVHNLELIALATSDDVTRAQLKGVILMLKQRGQQQLTVHELRSIEVANYKKRNEL